MENSGSVGTIFHSGVRGLWPGMIILNSLTCVKVHGLEMQGGLLKEFI